MANTNPQRLAGWASRWLTGELQALASVGNWEAAISTFQQMGDVTREEAVPGTQNMINSTSSNSSSSSSPTNSPPAAASPYHQQQNANARVFHYTTIISACAKADQWEASLKAFTHMHREAKCEPNVKTYTSVIHACTKGNRLDLALRAWAMMEADGVVANVFTTTALVAAFAKSGKWKEAINTTLEAEKNPFPTQEPNIFTYTAAMDACRRAEKSEEALKLLKRMTRERNVKGNTVSYTTALHACAGAKDWKSATEVLDMMKEDRIYIVPFAKTCALEALSDAPPEVAEKGLDPWLGPRPDSSSKSNNNSSNANAKKGGGKIWDDAAKTVTVTMKEKGGNNDSTSQIIEPEEGEGMTMRDQDPLQDAPTPPSYKAQTKW